MFACWLTILAATEDSVLSIWTGEPPAQANVRREAVASGIDPARLVFAAAAPRGAYLDRLRLADLLLDGRPCGPRTTASDALRARASIITCPGRAFASRVAASLAEYAALALALAHAPVRFAQVRARLATRRAASSLYDPQAFARGLEAGYRAIQARSLAGEPPADVVVEPLAANFRAPMQP